LLSGCYVPPPTAHAELQISATGSYTFNGHNVSGQELVARVEAAKQPGTDLVVQVESAPSARMDAVTFAVAALRAAHVRVAFVHGTHPS
jgi:biopolymer transport protein ExbD